MRRNLGLALLMTAALTGAALANDDPPKPAPKPKPNPELAAARQAIAVNDWSGALASLAAAERREPGNADVQNLLGYSHRNLGHLDLAFTHYARSLQLEPRHLGTHEYMGEAYLIVANLPKAEEHLAALQCYCPQVCEQRDDLAKAITEYKRRSAAAQAK